MSKHSKDEPHPGRDGALLDDRTGRYKDRHAKTEPKTTVDNRDFTIGDPERAAKLAGNPNAWLDTVSKRG